MFCIIGCENFHVEINVVCSSVKDMSYKSDYLMCHIEQGTLQTQGLTTM